MRSGLLLLPLCGQIQHVANIRGGHDGETTTRNRGLCSIYTSRTHTRSVSSKRRGWTGVNWRGMKGQKSNSDGNPREDAPRPPDLRPPNWCFRAVRCQHSFHLRCNHLHDCAQQDGQTAAEQWRYNDPRAHGSRRLWPCWPSCVSPFPQTPSISTWVNARPSASSRSSLRILWWLVRIISPN